MTLDKMLDSECASHEWSQSCVSCKTQIDLSVTQHTKVFECVSVRELRAVKEKGRQIAARSGVEAHHLRFLRIHCQGLLMGIHSQSVQHGLQLVVVSGSEGKIISEQHVGHFKTRNACDRTLYSLSQTVNVVQIDGKEEGGEGAPLLDTKRWLHIRSFVPIQQCVFISMIQALENVHKVVRHLAVVQVIPQLGSWN